MSQLETVAGGAAAPLLAFPCMPGSTASPSSAHGERGLAPVSVTWVLSHARQTWRPAGVAWRRHVAPLERAWRAPQEWAAEALGAERVVRTDSATPAAERHAAIERFNAPDRCGARAPMTADGAARRPLSPCACLWGAKCWKDTHGSTVRR